MVYGCVVFFRWDLRVVHLQRAGRSFLTMLQDVLSANHLRLRYCLAVMPADTDLPIPVAIFTVNRHHAYDTSCEVSLLTADLVLPEWRLIVVDPHRGQCLRDLAACYAIVRAAGK
jgi:hypothetical protein